jgi:alkyl hydroperoxide reductase subunit F
MILKNFFQTKIDKIKFEILDLIIIGAGPAGMSAAVYSSRRKLNTLVITGDIGGQTNWSAEVENYLGYDFMSGFELLQKFYQHVKKIDNDNDLFDLELIQNDEVVKVERAEKNFLVSTVQGKQFMCRAVLVATGAQPRNLNIPGEKELIGHGVTFCATCDGPLYRNKTIAVIGGGNSAMEAVLYLAKIAKFVYIININANFRGEITLAEEIQKLTNVELRMNTETLEMFGQGKLEKIKIKNKNTAQAEWLALDGVFEEIGYQPNSQVFADIVTLNEKKEIIIDAHNYTSVPGVFAAGDVSSVPQKQIIIAAGEGAKAVLEIYNYLLPK